jgi:hypothetical protein
MNPTLMPRVPSLAPLTLAVFALAGLLTVALFWSMSQ